MLPCAREENKQNIWHTALMGTTITCRVLGSVMGTGCGTIRQSS